MLKQIYFYQRTESNTPVAARRAVSLFMPLLMAVYSFPSANTTGQGSLIGFAFGDGNKCKRKARRCPKLLLQSETIQSPQTFLSGHVSCSFQATLTGDPCSEQLSIPEPIRPCTELSCFCSFRPPSGYIGPIVMNNDLKCFLSAEGSCCCLTSSSAAPVCCYFNLCILGRVSYLVIVVSSSKYF